MSTLKTPSLVAAAVVFLAAIANAQTKIEVTFQGSPITDLDDMYMAPDGTLILNGEFLDTAGVFSGDLLLSAPLTGGAATLVTGNTPAGDADQIGISPNGVIVFAGDGDDTGVLGLDSDANNWWSIPTTGDFFGGDLPTQISTSATTPLEIRAPRFSPDGSTLFFIKEVVDADDTQDPPVESAVVIASMAITGGAVTDLTPAPSDPGFLSGIRTHFSITPDGASVIFATADSFYSMPSSGGAPVQIPFSSELIEGAEIFQSAVTPDGESIVFMGDLLEDGVSELFKVPLGGGDPVLISTTPVSGGDVQSFVVSPDGSKVIYVSDEETNGEDELFIVSINGGESRKLNQPLVEGGDVRDNYESGIRFTPDGEQVVYHGDVETDGLREIFIVDTPNLGDFNADGVVDAADYAVYRNNLGAVDDVAINDAGDGVPGVTIDDYTVWVANFGETYAIAEAAAAATPEPASLGIALIVLAAAPARRRVTRTRS